MMRAMMRMALVVVIGLAIASVGRARADGAWLDAPLVNWNRVGAPVPTADTSEFMFDPFCDRGTRAPETWEDGQVADAGWRLSVATDDGYGIATVVGYTGTDGMCRPMNFNVFVFVDGIYAGSISPEPMFSRVDGVGFIEETATADGFTARFARYADADGACCPSRTSFVRFAIDRTEQGPLLRPVSVTTQPTGA